MAVLRIIMSAIGAEPDMRHYLALVDAGATDPERTLAVEFCCDAQHGIPYRNAVRV
jgi:hypothetical protein